MLIVNVLIKNVTKPVEFLFAKAVQPHIEGRLVRNPAHTSMGPVIIDYLRLVSK